MKKKLMGIVLALIVAISFNAIAFADGIGTNPSSAPICFDIDVQE